MRTSKTRLEKKLAADPSAILTDADVGLLHRELRRVLVSSLPTLPTDILDGADDTIRWHALGARCVQARGARGIRDVAIALGIPQYRLRAIEGGRFTDFRIDLARRYFRFLAIEEWVKRWCQSNRDLATRVGLIESRARYAGLPQRNAGRRGCPFGATVTRALR